MERQNSLIHKPELICNLANDLQGSRRSHSVICHLLLCVDGDRTVGNTRVGHLSVYPGSSPMNLKAEYLSWMHVKFPPSKGDPHFLGIVFFRTAIKVFIVLSDKTGYQNHLVK